MSEGPQFPALSLRRFQWRIKDNVLYRVRGGSQRSLCLFSVFTLSHATTSRLLLVVHTTLEDSQEGGPDAEAAVGGWTHYFLYPYLRKGQDHSVW